MKSPLALDRDDQRALAQLGSYALLVAGGLATMLLLAVTLAVCVRLFLLVSGLGAV